MVANPKNIFLTCQSVIELQSKQHLQRKINLERIPKSVILVKL